MPSNDDEDMEEVEDKDEEKAAAEAKISGRFLQVGSES